MTFRAGAYHRLYSRFAASLARTVTLRVAKAGGGFDDYAGVRAFVRGVGDEALMPGSTIQLEDVRVVILSDDLPAGLRKLSQKDRIVIDGRNWAIVSWNDQTRRVGNVPIAVEAVARA